MKIKTFIFSKIQTTAPLFCYMTARQWVIGPRRFEARQTPVIINPAARRNEPEDVNPQMSVV
jgi:hypothetical protein